MTTDRFPVLLSYKDPRYDRQRYARKRFSVPWDAVVPHERQAQRNHSQSLEHGRTMTTRKPDGAEELDCRFVNRRCVVVGPDGRRF